MRKLYQILYFVYRNTIRSGRYSLRTICYYIALGACIYRR